MYVIDVIPLSRTAPGVLSYRSSKDLPVGSIVDIVLRKASTQGIVVSSTHVQDAKEMLKHARFLLSKSAPSASGMLPDSVMQAAKEVALYHATTIGAVITALFAEYIRTGTGLPDVSMEQGASFVKSVVEMPLAERAAEYERHIAKTVVAGSAVMFVVPTLAEVLYWKARLTSYKPLILSGTLTPARRAKVLHDVVSHTGLIISTPSFSWTPISRLGCVIIDRISAGTYTLPKRPYLDVVYALTSLAKARAIPCIYGDLPLPLEYREETSPSIKTVGNVQLLDARKDPDAQEDADERWQVLSAPVIDAIKKELDAHGRVVVLATRSGYAPAVVCRDCGQALVDDRGMPLSFTTARGQRAFRSSDGKTILDAKMHCPRCESWNLLPLGVGQERVIEVLRSTFPDTTIVEASAEALRSPSAAKKLLAQIVEPATITVGGEAFLPWLLLASQDDAHNAPLGIIASADSLLSLPFWRSRERFVRLSYFFASLCREMILVTRHPEDAAVSAVANPTTSSFWSEERSLRKALGYPPYGTLITLTTEGTATAVAGNQERIDHALESYLPTSLPETAGAGNTIRRVTIITLPEGSWPDESLSQALQLLPPTIRVRIDPESLW